MKIFKNEVGRPSNETLNRRRNIKLFIAILVIAVIGVGGYFSYNIFFSSSINSLGKNVVSSSTATIKATTENGSTYKSGTWATKVKLTATINDKSGSSRRYTWYKDGSKYSSCTSSVCTISSSQTGSFKVLVRSGKKNYTSSSIKVMVDSSKISKISVSGSDNFSLGQLSAKVEPYTTISGYKYQWYKNGVIIKGATSSYYKATDYGTYSLKVTTGAGVSKVVFADVCYLKLFTGKTTNTWYNKDYNLTYTAKGPLKSVVWYKDGKVYNSCSGKRNCKITTNQNSNYCVKAVSQNGQNFSSCQKVKLDKSNNLSASLYVNNKKLCQIDGTNANACYMDNNQSIAADGNKVKLGTTLTISVSGTLFCSKYETGYKYYWYGNQKNAVTREWIASKLVSTSKTYKPTKKGFYLVTVETCNFQSKSKMFEVN